MKVLLVSDLHSQRRCLELLPKIIKKHLPDFLVCSGDITQNDDTQYFDEFISIIKEAKVDAGLIWGNNDREEIQSKILSSPYNIHLKVKTQDGWKFFGLGETEDIPFINPEDIRGGILVTHRPPLFEQLRSSLKNAPKYHISGHIHSVGRVKKFPSTTLIQVPSLTLGRYATFEPDKEQVKFFYA